MTDTDPIEGKGGGAVRGSQHLDARQDLVKDDQGIPMVEYETMWMVHHGYTGARVHGWRQYETEAAARAAARQHGGRVFFQTVTATRIELL